MHHQPLGPALGPPALRLPQNGGDGLAASRPDVDSVDGRGLCCSNGARPGPRYGGRAPSRLPGLMPQSARPGL